MKQFDLEKAKQGHPVVTRDGRPAEIVRYNLKGDYPIAAVVDDEMFFYTLEGRYWDRPSDHDADLFVTSVQKEGWLNIYAVDGNIPKRAARTSNFIYHNKEDAEIATGVDVIATVKVVWEE